MFLKFSHFFPGNTDPISAVTCPFNKVWIVSVQMLIKWLMQINARKG